MLDTGSQRSYLGSIVADALRCRDDSLSHIKLDVKTFLSSEEKTFSEIMLEVHLDHIGRIDLTLLINPKFALKMNVSQLDEVIANILAGGSQLADSSMGLS